MEKWTHLKHFLLSLDLWKTCPIRTSYFLTSLHNAKPHCRSQTLCRVHSSSSLPYAPTPPALLLESITLQNLQHHAFLGFQNASSVPWGPLGLPPLPEARNLLSSCGGTRGFQETWPVAFQVGLLEPFAACKFNSVQSRPNTKLTLKPLGSRSQLLTLESYHCAASWSPSPGLELSLLCSGSSIFTSSILKLCPALSFGERERSLMCAVLCLMHLVCSWEGEGRKHLI